MTLLPILLPEGYVPIVSVNDKLTAGSVIAEKTGAKKEEIIHLSKDYKIPQAQIKKSLKKNLGDAVSEGETVAIKEGKLGFGGQKIISKFSGTIVKIDEEEGNIYLRTDEKELSESLFSPVDGLVDFCNNEKIVIKTDKDAILAEDGLGEEKTGELLYIDDQFDSAKLTSEVEDRTILTKTINKLALFKAIGLNASGVITQKLEDTDFIDLTGKIKNIPVMVVKEEDFKKLSKSDGKKVYLGGKDKSIVIL